MGGELLVYNHVRFSVAINPPMPVPPKFAFFAGGIEGPTAKPPQPYNDKGTLIFPADPTAPPTDPIFHAADHPRSGFRAA